MTLVLALKASDGIVLASDGQATTEDPLAPTRGAAENKLFALHDRIAFGCAGSAGLQQRIVDGLKADISPNDCELPIAELRPKLHEAVNRLQHKALAEHVAISRRHHPAQLGMLFAGWTGDEQWVYEICPDGEDQLHPHGEAIGHARHFPAYLMESTRHYDVLNRGVEQVVVLAYRAVMDAIQTDAMSLGLPVHLVLVTEKTARRLDNDRLRSIEDTLNAWKDQEKDIFRALPGEPVAPAASSGDAVPGIEPKVAAVES
jgi:proteasome beta subunit